MFKLSINQKDVPDNMTENNYARMLFELEWDFSKDPIEENYEMNSHFDCVSGELVYTLTKLKVVG